MVADRGMKKGLSLKGEKEREEKKQESKQINKEYS